jgi:hypothetical protein
MRVLHFYGQTQTIFLTTKTRRHEDTKENRDKGRRKEGIGGGGKSLFPLLSSLLLVP